MSRVEGKEIFPNLSTLRRHLVKPPVVNEYLRQQPLFEGL